MNIKDLIFRIVKDGHFWQRTDVVGKTEVLKLFFSKTQLVFIFIAVMFHFGISKSLNDSFIGYAISALSIFVGLFLTLILSLFDKFQNTFLFVPENPLSTMTEDIEKIKRKNFFKQFHSLMSYAILISIFTIVLLSFKLIFNELDNCIGNYTPVFNMKLWNLVNVKKFLFLFVISIYNILVIYFLLDLILIILYGLGAIHNYLMLEYDKHKVKKVE